MKQKKGGGFNQKELEFCRLVMEGKMPSQAAKEAGYAKGAYGLELLKKEKIKAYLSERDTAQQTQGRKETDVAENEEILKFLTSIMRGDEYEERKDSIIKDRMKAAELLGKRMKLFEGTEEEDDTKIVIMDDIATMQGNRREGSETKENHSF